MHLHQVDNSLDIQINPSLWNELWRAAFVTIYYLNSRKSKQNAHGSAESLEPNRLDLKINWSLLKICTFLPRLLQPKPSIFRRWTSSDLPNTYHRGQEFVKQSTGDATDTGLHKYCLNFLDMSREKKHALLSIQFRVAANKCWFANMSSVSKQMTKNGRKTSCFCENGPNTHEG